MGRHAEPRFVVVAQLTGVAAGYGHAKRIDQAEALAEITEVLTNAKVRPGAERAINLLTEAAAMYVEPSGPGDSAWYPRAFALLADAGADPVRAATIRHARVFSPNLVR
jgi:hypothetical protein